jgi:hypothetical protein
MRSSPDSRTRILRVVDEPRREGEIGDPEDQLAATYRASDHTLVLIRPDGYIGLITDAGDARALTGYFNAIG